MDTNKHTHSNKQTHTILQPEVGLKNVKEFELYAEASVNFSEPEEPLFCHLQTTAVIKGFRPWYFVL